MTVCSIDPRFAFNTQDEHTEAPLTKVFLHMNSEGLSSAASILYTTACRQTRWKNKVKWSLKKKKSYTGKNSRNMTITSSS